MAEEVNLMGPSEEFGLYSKNGLNQVSYVTWFGTWNSPDQKKKKMIYKISNNGDGKMRGLGYV